MKHVLTLFCILFSICGHAQFTKGDKFIGGNISMRHDSYDNGDRTSGNMGFSPSIGFLMNKNFALGVGFDYSYYSYKNFYNGQPFIKQTSRSFGPQIFAKRFFTISEKFFFALTGDISYSGSRAYSTQNGGSTTRSYSLGAAITPSFIFFPSSHWGIEASLGNLSYEHDQEIPANGTKSNQINLDAGTFSLGFAYYLRK